MYRDSIIDIGQMQSTMRHVFIDEQSCDGTKARVAGGGIAMTAEKPQAFSVTAAENQDTQRATAPTTTRARMTHNGDGLKWKNG